MRNSILRPLGLVAFLTAGCGGENSPDALPDAQDTGALDASFVGDDARVDTADVDGAADSDHADSESPPDDGTTVTAGNIRWHPGHYVASNGVHKLGTKSDAFASEIDAACKEPNVLGWRGIYSWAALEPKRDTYDFSVIDAELATLKSCAPKPKRIGLLLLATAYGSTTPSSSILPSYLLGDPAFGPGADGVHFGYWGTGSTYTAALWRPAVNDRFIALAKALGAHFNAERGFEVLMLPETASFVVSGTDFSDAALLAEEERLVTASVASFPNANVSIQNNYMATMADTATLVDFTWKNRAAQNGPDIWGATAVTKYGAAKGYTWGQFCFLGLGSVPGCTADLRGRMPIIHDIQEPEMDGTQFTGLGSPFTPLDLFDNADGNLHVSHIFWTWLGGSGPGNWTSVAAMIDTHPVTHTACPASYATGCDGS